MTKNICPIKIFSYLIFTIMSSAPASHAECSKALFARRLVRHKIAAELNALEQRNEHSPLGFPSSGPYTHDTLPPDPNYQGHKRVAHGGDGKQPPRKVCSVGKSWRTSGVWWKSWRWESEERYICKSCLANFERNSSTGSENSNNRLVLVLLFLHWSYQKNPFELR